MEENAGVSIFCFVKDLKNDGKTDLFLSIDSASLCGP